MLSVHQEATLRLVVNSSVVLVRLESISQEKERHYVSIAGQASTSMLEEELVPVTVLCARPANLQPLRGRAHAHNAPENTTLLK